MSPIQKKTKIVATIGPKTESVEMLEKLISAGLNVARLNMSHGNHEEHKNKIKNIRQAEKNTGSRIAILLDLSGPKIRTGEYATERINIEAGKKIILTTENIIGDNKKIYVNYPNLSKEVKKGNYIMLDDGKKKLQVEKIEGENIFCKIIIGGELKSKRGVNIPGAYLSIPSITKKDKIDLQFGLKEGVDIIAFSFVRTASDVIELKSLLKKAGKNLPIVSKIETQEAINNLDEIIKESDGIMVARGDLAIEVPAEMVPIYQKNIIAKCNALGKPVITATQMLESMINNPVPTRAEVSDIANAIYDGTDAIMLSEESTLGSYPIEAVTMMTKIAHSIENNSKVNGKNENIEDAISIAVYDIINKIDAKGIIVLTETGSTAKLISRRSKNTPIYAFTFTEKIAHELNLVKGVFPIFINSLTNFEEAIEITPKYLLENKLAKKGDKFIIVAGLPFSNKKGMNLIYIINI